MLTLGQALRIAVNAVLVLYIVSVVLFIWRVRRYDKQLASGFFTLYSIACVAEAVVIFNVSVNIRIGDF